MTERCGGILLHISALPGKYGIGDLGTSAFRFVDFLAGAGQKIWQILPLVPAGFGNSPYQSVSVFAGNPLFIDLEEFLRAGNITAGDLEPLVAQNDDERVRYEAIAALREELLRKIYDARFRGGENAEEDEALRKFCEKSGKWLREYAIFATLKENFGGRPWYRWPRKYKFKSKGALKAILRDHAGAIRYHCWVQFTFYRQWAALKAHAARKGVRILGDLPIYVSTDSADAWGNRELFQFTRYGKAKRVAGCPPDYFSKTGQLWGNILYDWEAIRERRYRWWIERLRHSFGIYDIARLDHFIGFSSYWSIPAGDATAVNGRWERGPGMRLFGKVRKDLGSVDIVAEDLGALSAGVRKLLRDTGFPGMKILQFAFDSYDSDYLPHKYPEEAFAYTGTHDNNTLAGWLSGLPDNIADYARSYTDNFLGAEGDGFSATDKMILAVLKSKAGAAVIPMQDYLGTGADGRFNTPSTVGPGNWSWRVAAASLTEALMTHIRRMTEKFQR
ncbi:MAG: 4-alpha-glucanotransferase [Fusobacteriaceae bacterium]|jgi:4-alpha-glucanotransferase|nr:4-alpha-glucanotransferase [Fusobacteriaceae bacterium]